MRPSLLLGLLLAGAPELLKDTDTAVRRWRESMAKKGFDDAQIEHMYQEALKASGKPSELVENLRQIEAKMTL